MRLEFDDERAIYLQLADALEDAVFTGAFAEGAQVPSTTEMSAQLRINPATVMKAMGRLVERGVLQKKRGVGMFVTEGAVESIRDARQAKFYEEYVVRLLEEAQKLGIGRAELVALIERGMAHERD